MKSPPTEASGQEFSWRTNENEWQHHLNFAGGKMF